MKPTQPGTRKKTTKSRITSDRYWIEARDQGDDLHLLIGKRDGSPGKAHFIIDNRSAEIRVEDQRAVPEELVRSIETVLSMRDGRTVRFRRDVDSSAWRRVSHVSPSESLLSSLQAFGASIVQTGGIGSRLVTATAWLLDDHGYLDAQQIVQYMFSGAGDFLVVTPPEGFHIVEPESPTGNTLMGGDQGDWCGMSLRDDLKNELTFHCHRPGPGASESASAGA